MLIVESDVCMVNKGMILFTKRLRFKAPSAAPLSPGQFGDRQGIGFISCQLFIVTQSPKGEGNWNLNQGEVKERLKWKRGLDSSY